MFQEQKIMWKTFVDLPKTCQKKFPKFEVLFSMSTAYTQNLGLSSKCKMPYTQSPSRSRFWRHRTRRRVVRNQWEPAGGFKEPMWFHQKSTRKKSLNSKRDIKMNLWLMTNPKIYISWADLGGQTPKEGMLRDAQSFHPSKMENWLLQMVTAHSLENEEVYGYAILSRGTGHLAICFNYAI